MAFHPTENSLAVAGGDDHEVTLWDLRKTEKPLDVAVGKGTGIWAVALAEKREEKSEKGKKKTLLLGFKTRRNHGAKNPNEMGAGDWQVFDLDTCRWAENATKFEPSGTRETLGGWSVEPQIGSRWKVCDPKGDSFVLPLDRGRDQFPTCYTGRYSATLPTGSQILPGAGLDAAVGIFGGLPLALTNVGAVDVLLSATYLPEVDENNVRVTLPNGSLHVGYGARIGLLSESILVPGVSLSFMKRDLPTADISANSGVADSLFVTGLKVKTTSWRIEASKSLIMFGVFGGVGRDRYESSVETVRASVGAPVVGRANATLSPSPSQAIDRTNVFVGLKLNLLLFKIAGEVGQASGGDVTTFNTFSGSAPAASRTYGSLGIRFGI